MEISRSQIGERLVAARGRRSRDVLAEKLGISDERLRQLESGQVPNAFLYLARLRQEGVDLHWLLTGE